MSDYTTGTLNLDVGDFYDVEFSPQRPLMGILIESDGPVQITGPGCSPTSGQELKCTPGTVGSTQSEFTEVDGSVAIGFPPIPLVNAARKRLKWRITNGSGVARKAQMHFFVNDGVL